MEMEVAYYKKLFQTIGNIIELIEKDDIPKYLLFLENAFPYMDNYNYHKGMCITQSGINITN